MNKHWMALALLAGAIGLVYARAGTKPVAVGIFENYQDVGTPKPGMAIFDSGAKAYKVTGGGANIWSTKDAFQFVYTRLSGDVTFQC